MKLSVCVPVFNASPEYLGEALESALRQKGPFELEVIVSDDASDVDYTELKSRYPQVRFGRNRQNVGMVENWNCCVGMSSGELVLVLLQDDRIEGGLLALYLQEFLDNQQVVVCACARRFINSTGAAINPRRGVNDRANIFIHQERYALTQVHALHLCLRNGNAIGEPSSVMFRRAIFNQLGGYDPAFQHAADLDFNLRAAEKGEIIYLNNPYLLRRLHKSRLTDSNRRLGRIGKDRIAMYERHSRALLELGMDMAPYRAYLTACALRDLIFFITTGKWKFAGQSLVTIWSYGRLRPGIYLKYALEIASGKNRDAL